MKSIYFTFIITIMISTIQGAPEKMLSIPLKRNPNYVPNIHKQLLKTHQKYNIPTGQVPLVDVSNDTEYTGIIYAGTPPRPFSVDFDTGSSNFWLDSSLCSVCTNHTVYDPSNSSSFSPDGRPWSITYGDLSTSSGMLVYDTVNIGGITIKNISIYATMMLSGNTIDPAIDGLLGLAFDKLATVPGVKTPFQVIVDRKLISSPVFSVYLGKAVDGGEEYGGEFIFGGYNSSLIDGDLTTIPVNNTIGFWMIDIDDIRINNSSVLHKSSRAIVDTGTTLLLLPQKLALEISKKYNATDNSDGSFKISCNEDELQPLDIEIGGTTFTIPPDALISERQPNNCTAGFAYADSLSEVILGDVFIKNYYLIFNTEVPQIQIATLKA